MYRILCLAALISAVTANDVTHGHINGKKIFDSNQTASPAIWRRADNFTVNATNDEVITGIVITDLREKKDGEAQIVEGGEGHKNVTFELKSPAVFRGYEFHVEVYTAPDNEKDIHTNVQQTKDLHQVPAFVGKDDNMQTEESKNVQTTITETSKDVQTTVTEPSSTEQTVTDIKIHNVHPTSETFDVQTSTNQMNNQPMNPAMDHDIKINSMQTTEATVDEKTTLGDHTTEKNLESTETTTVDVSQYALLKNSPQIQYGYQNKHMRKDVV